MSPQSFNNYDMRVLFISEILLSVNNNKSTIISKIYNGPSGHSSMKIMVEDAQKSMYIKLHDVKHVKYE